MRKFAILLSTAVLLLAFLAGGCSAQDESGPSTRAGSDNTSSTAASTSANTPVTTPAQGLLVGGSEASTTAHGGGGGNLGSNEADEGNVTAAGNDTMESSATNVTGDGGGQVVVGHNASAGADDALFRSGAEMSHASHNRTDVSHNGTDVSHGGGSDLLHNDDVSFSEYEEGGSSSYGNATQRNGSVTVGDGTHGGGGHLVAVADLGGESTPVNLQTQIYIVAGTLGGIVLLLILLVLALALSIANLKSQIQKSKNQRYIPELSPVSQTSPPPRQAEQIHAYDNSAFMGGHEMQERRVDPKTEIERMGYSVYNGKQQENRYSNPRDNRGSTMMRAEESVTSYNDKPDRRSGGYRY